MTIERGPRDPDLGPDASKRETLHTFDRDDLDGSGDEGAFEIAMVISTLF
jgi:hypothetical protein